MNTSIERGKFEVTNSLATGRWAGLLAHALLYLIASIVLLRLLHTVDRAPYTGPADPLALIFIFGSMAVLRLIAHRAGLTDWRAVWLPVLFVMALPFTFLQRTDAHDFGEWFAVLLIAYVGLRGSYWLVGLLVSLCAVATPVAIWMPLICLPIFVQQIGWQRAFAFVGLCIASVWSVGVMADAYALGHSSGISLTRLNHAFAKGWRVLNEGHPGGWRGVLKLVPTGANLLNVLVLVFLLERYVLAAARSRLVMLVLAFGCCVGLSLLNRQVPAHLLALVIPPLFICLVDGLQRVPALWSSPPEVIDMPPRNAMQVN